MRVGLLTGGGDCPGLNAVIRAVVRKGEMVYGDEVIGFLDAWDGVQQLRRVDSGAYRALVLLVLAAYYRSPEVAARIGWPGPIATPVGRFDFPEYLSEGLLDHMIPKDPT